MRQEKGWSKAVSRQILISQNAQYKIEIKYYCECCDLEFDTKMHDVLVVYKQVSMRFDQDGNIIIHDEGLDGAYSIVR